MIKVKDGYGKLIGTNYKGSASNILKSDGGDVEYSTTSSANTLVQRNASGLIESSLATGTSPFKVTSTTVVSNLNADLLDGIHKEGLLTALTSTRSNNLSITVGGTTKNISDLYATFVRGTYTKNGGCQFPEYIESGVVRWNMTLFRSDYFTEIPVSGYCDWMMMDTYTGNDVPWATMIGVLKAENTHAYIASGAKGSTNKWNVKTLLDSSNYSDYLPTYNGSKMTKDSKFYRRTTTVNDLEYAFVSATSSTNPVFTIYSPTTAGSAGQILKSNGSGAPSWVNNDLVYKNAYYFANGYLVKLDIPIDESVMCNVRITGNSYGDIPINTYIEFYNFAETTTHFHYPRGIHYGHNFGNIEIFNKDGYIYLWFKLTNLYSSASVYANASMHGVSDTKRGPNIVLYISNEAMPTEGITKKSTITPTVLDFLDKLNLSGGVMTGTIFFDRPYGILASKGDSTDESYYSIINNHQNGNISVNAAGGSLFLGYTNTKDILCRGSYTNIDSGNYTNYFKNYYSSSTKRDPNTVLAGPSSGTTTAAATFRKLVADDIPNLDTSKLTSGVLSAARGGTGQSTLINAANSLLNSLSTGDANPGGDDYYISLAAGGGTTTTTYHRRPVKYLYNYIKGNLDSVYLPLSGGTVTGELILNSSYNSTDSTTKGLVIRRNTSNAESLRIYTNDYGPVFEVNQDEAACGIKFNLIANATENPDSTTASNSSITFGNASGVSTVTANKFAGSLVGNADSATKLVTARTIWGQSFNGTSNIDGKLTITSGGMLVTGTAYFGGGTTYYFGSAGNVNCNTLTVNDIAIFKGTPIISNSTNPVIYFKEPNTNSTLGHIYYITSYSSTNKKYTAGRFLFRQYSYEEGTSTALTAFERYYLPQVETDLTENKDYYILTSKNYSSYLGYIGTTAVQASSADQALTGITNLTMSGNLTITPGNTDRFINFSYNSGSTYSWRLGYLGTGSGDANYFVIQSAKAAGTSWNNVIRLGNETLDAAFGGNVYPLANNTQTLGTSNLKWKNVYATTFTGNLSGNATTSDSTNILLYLEISTTDMNTMYGDTYRGTSWYGGGGNSAVNNPLGSGTAFGMQIWRNASGYTAQLILDENSKLHVRLYTGGSAWHALKTFAFITDITKSQVGLGNVQNIAFYPRKTNVNGEAWNMAGTNSSDAFTIYAPTTAGTSGQVLISSGGVPTWSSQINADTVDDWHKHYFNIGYNGSRHYHLKFGLGNTDLTWKTIVKGNDTIVSAPTSDTYHASTIFGTIWYQNGNHYLVQVQEIPFSVVFRYVSGKTIINDAYLYLPQNAKHLDIIRIVRTATNSFELLVRQSINYNNIWIDFQVIANGTTITPYEELLTAGTGTVVVTAETAETLTSSKITTETIGSTTNPIYLNEGIPTACSGRTVPGIKTASGKTHTNFGTTNSYAIDVSMLSYWNGAYNSSGSSNLEYCAKGKFGDIVTKNIADLSIGEAYLSWGGKAIAGDLSPLDVALDSQFSANRLSFMPADDIVVEYSTDGGITWEDYGLTDKGKQSLVTTGIGYSLYMGKKTTGQKPTDQLRVTITATNGKTYFALKKIFIYLATQGATGANVLIEEAKIGSDTTFTAVAGAYPVAGWSGWNSIPLIRSFGGSASQTNQTRRIRMTFGFTNNSSNYTETTAFGISRISMHGTPFWANSGGTLPATGHMYSYNINKDVTFPEKVTATQFIGNLTGDVTGLATSATNIYVNQHTENDVEYPLVWSNQNNTEHKLAQQLCKSYGALSYNPKNNRIKVGLITITNTEAAPHINFSRTSYNYINAPTGGIIAIVPNGGGQSSASGYYFDGTSFYAGTTNNRTLGKSANEWKGVYTKNLYVGYDSTASKTKLVINSDGQIYPAEGYRNAGMYGVYDSGKVGLIWSMGTSYYIKADGSSTNSLYGLAYFHTNWSNDATNNATTRTQEDGTTALITPVSSYAGNHQVAWCINGVVYAALGTYVWSKNGFKKQDSSNDYVLLGGGGHKALSEFTTGTVTSVTPGTGLTNGTGETAITTSGTLNLKTASASEIGGVKIAKDNSSYTVATNTSAITKNITSGKYYGVEIDSTDKAFVYVPWSNTTYTLSGSLSGDIFEATLTPSSGSPSTFTISAMTGASNSLLGAAGLVPEPLAGDNTAFLRGDGTWVNIEDTKVTNTLGTTTQFYLTGTASSTTNTGTLYFDTNIYTSTTAGALHAKTFRRYDGATTNSTPLLHAVSDNTDVTILRASHAATESFTNTASHGFSLNYIGTGSGNANYLKLFADNQTSNTQALALCVDQKGNIGIGIENDDNYKLHVAGTTKIDGSITIEQSDYTHTIQGDSSGALVLEGSEDIILNSQVNATLRIIPTTDNSITLGDSSLRWSNIYVTKINNKGISDSTEASALVSTSSNFVTERDVYYGLPKINNSHTYTSSTSIYAPTAGGTSGYYLKGNGTTSAPVWQLYSSTPTSGSTTLITSGGVYTALGNYLSKSGGTTTGLITLGASSWENTIKWANTDFPGATALAFMGNYNDFVIRVSESTESYIDLRFNITRLTYSGNLEIGGNITSTGSLTAQNGSFYTNANGVYWTSDRKFKKNIISPVKSGLLEDETGFIRKFDWKSNGVSSYGYIAQEILPIIPEAVDYDESKDKYSVNYSVAHSFAIAQLIIKVRELENEIEHLKQDLKLKNS